MDSNLLLRKLKRKSLLSDDIQMTENIWYKGKLSQLTTPVYYKISLLQYQFSFYNCNFLPSESPGKSENNATCYMTDTLRWNQGFTARSLLSQIIRESSAEVSLICEPYETYSMTALVVSSWRNHDIYGTGFVRARIEEAMTVQPRNNK